MNIYKSLNEIVEYIEKHLEEKIEYKALANILGVNEYTMQTIFNLLSNVTLSEYIRKRRLSNAGIDIYKTEAKIIDIAIKYQYENATSFSRAFEKFHGIKPSEVRKNPEELKVYAKIVFDEQKEIQNQDIPYSIIEQEELILYGKGTKTTEENISQDAPNFYRKINKEFYNEYGANIPYGMTVYEKRFESNKLEYWVLYDRKIKGFEKYIIPKGKWLLFHVPTQEAEDIQLVTKRVYNRFIPSCKYNFRPIPELEHYHDEVTDFLIPIED